jgi:hypothetical protein
MPNGEQMNIIIKGHPNTKEPFMCLQGTLEYHSHPQHNGDSWDLYRYRGEGTSFFILENIWKYCINTIKKFSFQLRIDSPQVLIFQEGTKE